MNERDAIPWPVGRLLVVTAAGALLGSVAELVHHRAGVWQLDRPLVLPWWIAAVYFVALTVIAAAIVALEHRAGHPLASSRRAVAMEGLLIVVAFIAPVLLHRHELLLAAIATVGLVARLGWFRVRGDLALAALAMGLDLVVEGCLVGASLYRYPGAQWLPLPLWLAPLWGCIGLGLRRLVVATVLGRR